MQKGVKEKKITHQDHIYLEKADTRMCAYNLQEPREALGMKKKKFLSGLGCSERSKKGHEIRFSGSEEM